MAKVEENLLLLEISQPLSGMIPHTVVDSKTEGSARWAREALSLTCSNLLTLHVSHACFNQSWPNLLLEFPFSTGYKTEPFSFCNQLCLDAIRCRRRMVPRESFRPSCQVVTQYPRNTNHSRGRCALYDCLKYEENRTFLSLPLLAAQASPCCK